MDSSGDFERLKAIAKGIPIERVVGKYLRLTRVGKEFRALCPFHSDRHPSLTVVPQRGFYKCHACGASGDGIKFVMEKDGVDFISAVRGLCVAFGYASGTESLKTPKKEPFSFSAPPPIERDQNKIYRAETLFRRSVPAAGTVVETYLSSRGIDTNLLPEGVLRQLRFVETEYWASLAGGKYRSLGTHPVMLAPMQYRDGRILAVHLTYLLPDGSGKLKIVHPVDGVSLPAKKMIGESSRCAIRLGPRSPIMAIAEGIETGLSFVMARPSIPVWVAGSIGNMAGRGVGQGEPHPEPKREGQRLPSVIPDLAHPGVEVPHGTRRVFLIADNDSSDQYSINAQIERAARRIALRRIEVSIIWPPKGLDLNDVLQGDGHALCG